MEPPETTDTQTVVQGIAPNPKPAGWNETWCFPWHPPPDPAKPHCPYVPGFTTLITPHIPPDPYGNRYYGPGRASIPDTTLKTHTQSAFVSLHGPEDIPSSSESQTLTIESAMQTGDLEGAQVVVCTVSRLGKAVAKIYDPLYYSYSHEIFSSIPVDVVWEAEGEYARETAAYEFFEKTTCGHVPRYYGAWSMGRVRLILMEWVEGKPIKGWMKWSRKDGGLSGRRLDRAWRVDVLGKVLEAWVGVERGVWLRAGLSYKNVVVGEQGEVRVVDFGEAVVWERTKEEWRRAERREKSVMARFWGDVPDCLRGWVPRRWVGNKRLWQAWLVERFGGGAIEEGLVFTDEETVEMSDTEPEEDEVPGWKRVAPPPRVFPGDRVAAWPINFFGSTTPGGSEG